MSLFAELKRRNVFRMGGAYLALGWVVTQVTATVAPALGMPEWTLKLVVWLGIIGFPLIVAFAWAYELTPEGIRRESELPPSTDIRHASARRLDYITIGMIAVALLFFVAHRLLAPARESAQPATVDATSGGAHARSIAVLPFINLSGDSAQAYFTDGITADLITDLARLPGLMVIARTSSFAYKGKQVRPQQIAQELGIRYLLEGSVQRQGDRLRINAQLIDAVGGQHLWAERYSGTMEDVFALQDKVIGEIVAALQLKLPDTSQSQRDLESCGLRCPSAGTGAPAPGQRDRDDRRDRGVRAGRRARSGLRSRARIAGGYVLADRFDALGLGRRRRLRARLRRHAEASRARHARTHTAGARRESGADAERGPRRRGAGRDR